MPTSCLVCFSLMPASCLVHGMFLIDAYRYFMPGTVLKLSSHAPGCQGASGLCGPNKALLCVNELIATRPSSQIN